MNSLPQYFVILNDFPLTIPIYVPCNLCFCLYHRPLIPVVRSLQIIYQTLNKRSSRMRVTSALFLKGSLFFWKANLLCESGTKAVVFVYDGCVWWCEGYISLFYCIFHDCSPSFIWICFFCSLHLRKVKLTVAFTLFTYLIWLMLWKPALFLRSILVHYRDDERIKCVYSNFRWSS